MSVVVVAEKPSVARDIARVLGAHGRGEGLLHGNGYVVTWAIGHLVGLAEPHQVNAAWKRWDFSQLPMIPKTWPLVVLPGTKAQFAVIRKLLRDSSVERVVCATDAGREGELIFRYIYEAAGCQKPVQRLWISSLTDAAIREGFRRLRPARDFDALADAARGRSQADWLVGMNLSRAYGLHMDQPLSVGRVQTPTLALLVDREEAIRDFKPVDYLEVVARFEPRAGVQYEGTWYRERAPGEKTVSAADLRRLPVDGQEAQAIIERARRGKARIADVRSETRRMPPPLLYDLSELQRHANRLYGLGAQRTLEVAQALYERHKLLSYPRTDSRHLSRDVAATLPEIVRAISAPYTGKLAPGTGVRALGPRFVNDARVTDHHAIIPTEKLPRLEALTVDERRLYDLVCRRLLGAWHGDHVWDVTSVVTEIHDEASRTVDRYRSTGTAVREPGWKVLDVVLPAQERPAAGDEASQRLPAGLAAGQTPAVVDARAVKKTTRPPPRYTEATLLSAMESAGEAVDDKELSKAMKERGLGTPATRAAIIETLLARGYVVRRGRQLEVTDKGMALVAVVDPSVKSPAMTGDWEARLKRIERGEESLSSFMDAITRYVREVVTRVPPPPAGRPRKPWPSPPGRGTGQSGRRVAAGARRSGRRSRTPVSGNRRGPASGGPDRPDGPSGAPPDPALDDAQLSRQILEALRRRDGQSTGRLCRALLGEAAAARQRFESVLSTLLGSGQLRLTEDVFEADGRRIPFKRAWVGAPRAPKRHTP